MKREEVLRSPDYWMAKTQIELYNCAMDYVKKNKMTDNELSANLKLSKHKVSLLLSGEYKPTLYEFFEVLTALGYIPNIKIVPREQYKE